MTSFYKGILKVVVPIALVGALVAAVVGNWAAAIMLVVLAPIGALGLLIPEPKKN